MFLVLMAISLSLDALGVSLSYGLRGVHIPLKSLVTISVVSAAYFGVACLLGSAIFALLPEGTARFISMLLLALLCLWMSAQTLLAPRDGKSAAQPQTLARLSLQSLGITVTIIRNPMLADMDSSNSIDCREAVFLAAALSMDSVGIGVSYAMMGGFSLLAPLVVGLFQLTFTCLGNGLGLRLAQRTKAKQFKLQLISCAVLWVLFFVRLAFM